MAKVAAPAAVAGSFGMGLADKVELSGASGGGAAAAAPKLDLSQITARKNLNETAFFFPQLTSDPNGVVRMTFTMPEALMKWRFMGFAYDRLARSGYLEDHAVTAKDFMVQPNPPRFLREGDTIEFSVKVSNQSDKPQAGVVRLTFNDTLTEKSADNLLGNAKPEQNFSIPAKESRSFAWRITVPDGCGFLTYKAVGATAAISDGGGRRRAGALAAHPDHRIAAAAYSRAGHKEVRVHRTAQVWRLEDAPE